MKLMEINGTQWKSMKFNENHWKSMRINEKQAPRSDPEAPMSDPGPESIEKQMKNEPWAQKLLKNK